ncbi:hypothetical protein N9N67_10085 [Bacteriovoracaceae bacterium]|nr:hypothetical protein [Bacteriovoracaceae bacterium]
MFQSSSKKLCTFLISATILSPTVFSQSTGSVQSSQSTLKSPMGRMLKKALPDRVTYFSIVSGPNLDDGGDPYEADGVVDEGGFGTWNQISLQWEINDKFRFVFNPRFGYTFSENIAEDEEAFSLINPVVGITGVWYKKGNFQFAGGINTIVPPMREEDTIEDGLIYNPGGFNDVGYRFNSSLRVGSWVWARYMIYDRETELDDTRYATFLAPYINYTINDNLTFTPFYQINGEETYDKTLEFDNTESLNLMLSIKVSSMLRIEPMITTFRETDFDVAKGNLNVWLSGRF